MMGEIIMSASAPTLQTSPIPANPYPYGPAPIDNANVGDVYKLSQSGTYAPLVLNLGDDGGKADIIDVTAPTVTGTAILGANDILNLPEGWLLKEQPSNSGNPNEKVYTNADGTATFAVTGGGQVNFGATGGFGEGQKIEPDHSNSSGLSPIEVPLASPPDLHHS
jgi:hypothetical protein